MSDEKDAGGDDCNVIELATGFKDLKDDKQMKELIRAIDRVNDDITKVRSDINIDRFISVVVTVAMIFALALLVFFIEPSVCMERV